MGQNELLRPFDLGIKSAGRALTDACAELLDADLTEMRAELIAALARGRWPSETLHDVELDAIREQFRRFTDAKIIPHAHKWHLANDLIPDATVQAMADLGTFGVCIPTEFGGLGLNKLVMCVAGIARWIGTGLSTGRDCGRTHRSWHAEQKRYQDASGADVFPRNGSDPLRCRPSNRTRSWFSARHGSRTAVART